MEFMSLGAYQFGISLSKMVPFIDLESRTTIHVPKNVKSLKHFHHTGQEQKLTTTRSFTEECLSFRYTQLP